MERSADWLDQARGDLSHARNDLEDGFYDWACFSAQQAAEKALKGLFQKAGVEAWGHSIVDLLVGLEDLHPVPAELAEYAKELDQAYIPTRYPNAHPAGSPRGLYTRTQAARLVTYADQVLRFCEALLPGV